MVFGMIPMLLLAVAASPPADGPVADGGVLSSTAQWDALAASPRVLMQKGNAGTATGITLGVRDGFAYVLTASHAIPDDGAEREVQFFNREAYPRPAHRFQGVEVVAKWSAPDLALMKVKTGPDRVPVIPLAGPGQRPTRYPFDAISVGCSNGGPPVCRVETVTAKRVAKRPGDAFAFFWELSAPPAPGRSGGPLLDDQGRVIGVCAAAQGKSGYYTHLDEVLVGLKREGYGWLWQAGK
jgi:S1-C subfamily serine protease